MSFYGIDLLELRATVKLVQVGLDANVVMIVCVWVFILARTVPIQVKIQRMCDCVHFTYCKNCG